MLYRNLYLRVPVRRGSVAIALSVLLFVSCEKTKDATPELPKIKFTTDASVLDQNETDALVVNLTLSQALLKPGTVSIVVDEKSTADLTDYTLDPAAVSGVITLALDAGATTASFTVAPQNRMADNKTILFNLDAATGGIILDNTDQTTTVTIKKDSSGATSIATSLSSLEDFGNVDNGNFSASKSYMVQGSGLSADLAIVASDNFQVSLDDKSFADSIGVDASVANASSVKVYVRFAPESGSNLALTGTITQSSAGASHKVVTVTGTESGNVIGNLILEENFDYGAKAGDLTEVSSVWTNYSGTTEPVQYVVPGLSFAGYGGSGVGGAVTAQNGKGSREDVTTAFTTQSAGTLYSALLVNISKASPSASGDFFLSLRDSDGDYLDRVYAKDDGKGNLQLGVVKNRSGNGDIVYATGTYSYHTTYLIVVKYDFSSATTSMYVIQGAIPGMEPANPDAVTNTGTDPDAFDNIVIRQSTDDIAASIDGIRIAKTWKDVIGL